MGKDHMNARAAYVLLLIIAQSPIAPIVIRNTSLHKYGEHQPLGKKEAKRVVSIYTDAVGCIDMSVMCSILTYRGNTDRGSFCSLLALKGTHVPTSS